MTARFDLAVLEEPGLEFGYGQRLEHPKDGLLLYGPSRNPFLSGTLRIGLISTEGGAGRYTAWVHRVNNVIPPAKPGDPNHTIFPGSRQFSKQDGPRTRRRESRLMLIPSGAQSEWRIGIRRSIKRSLFTRNP